MLIRCPGNKGPLEGLTFPQGERAARAVSGRRGTCCSGGPTGSLVWLEMELRSRQCQITDGMHTLLKLPDYSRSCCTMRGCSTWISMSCFQLRTVAGPCHPHPECYAPVTPVPQPTTPMLPRAPRIFQGRTAPTRRGTAPFMCLENSLCFLILALALVTDHAVSSLGSCLATTSLALGPGISGGRE